MMLAALLGVLLLAAALGGLVWVLGVAALGALVAARPLTLRAWLAWGASVAAGAVGYVVLATVVGALVTGP